MAERERVALVKQALAVERGDDGCGERARQELDNVGCPRPKCAAAGQDDRALGLCQNFSRPENCVGRYGGLWSRRKRRRLDCIRAR